MIQKTLQPKKNSNTLQKPITTKASVKKVSVKKASVKKVAKKVVTSKKPVSAKVAKKTVTNRVAVPVVKMGKVRQKKNRKVPLTQAPDEKKFWVHSGEVLASLVELAELFTRMDELVYKYHVTTTKNDFAEWVEHVLDDALCAQSLRRAKTPRSARLVVVRHLKRYDV